MFFSRGQQTRRRRGAVAVIVTVLIIVLFGMVAFAVDIGWIALTKAHLQNAADAASLAAAAKLGQGDTTIKNEAKKFAKANIAGGPNDEVILNGGDIKVGYWDSSTKTFDENGTIKNAVKVVAKRDLSLYFAGVLGVGTRHLEAESIAVVNTRDIAFVIDLSGSMNNDSEIWSTAAINTAYPTPAGVGSDLVAALFSDFGFGSYPGVTKHVGEGYIPSAQLTTNAYNYLATTYLLNNLSVDILYRILLTDSAATKKSKVYKWIIDTQLAAIMPLAKPTPSSANSSSLAFWTVYLDYVIDGGGNPPANQGSYKISSASNPYNDAWPNLTSSSISSFYNKLGYLTYVQFMQDYGWNKQAANTYVPLSRLSGDCPWRFESDTNSPGYGLYFPPREQPTHATRMAVMAAIKQVGNINANVNDALKDHVAVITFDTVAGSLIKYPLSATACDYPAAKASVRDLQAVADDQYSTASEPGLILAKQHLDPNLNANARTYAEKVVIFLSDGIPNLKSTSDATISSFVTGHPSGEWFSSGSFQFHRNAALMQVTQMQAMGWKTYAVGIGLGCDRTLMDRLARAAGTAKTDPNNVNGPKISPWAEGNPADYEQRLTAIFNEIVNRKNATLAR